MVGYDNEATVGRMKTWLEERSYSQKGEVPVRKTKLGYKN